MGKIFTTRVYSFGPVSAETLAGLQVEYDRIEVTELPFDAESDEPVDVQVAKLYQAFGEAKGFQVPLAGNNVLCVPRSLAIIGLFVSLVRRQHWGSCLSVVVSDGTAPLQDLEADDVIYALRELGSAG